MDKGLPDGVGLRPGRVGCSALFISSGCEVAKGLVSSLVPPSLLDLLLPDISERDLRLGLNGEETGGACGERNCGDVGGDVDASEGELTGLTEVELVLRCVLLGAVGASALVGLDRASRRAAAAANSACKLKGDLPYCRTVVSSGGVAPRGEGGVATLLSGAILARLGGEAVCFCFLHQTAGLLYRNRVGDQCKKYFDMLSRM